MMSIFPFDRVHSPQPRSALTHLLLRLLGRRVVLLLGEHAAQAEEGVRLEERGRLGPFRRRERGQRRRGHAPGRGCRLSRGLGLALRCLCLCWRAAPAAKGPVHRPSEPIDATRRDEKRSGSSSSSREQQPTRSRG